MKHVHRWQITTKNAREWGVCACGAHREFDVDKRFKTFGTEPLTPRKLATLVRVRTR